MSKFSSEMDQVTRESPSPQHATTTGTAYGHAIQNMKSLLMKCAIASTPSKSLNTPQKTFIEKRVQDFLPIMHTPDHPPYAWMIENAIKGLNEEGGSTEEAISTFLLEEYKDLPWAHAALLKHHLRKHSGSSNLIESHNGCYLIGKASVSRCLSSKTTQNLTCTTCRSPSLSPSYSFSPTYASSSTSSSSRSFSLKANARENRNYNRKRTRRRKQNAGVTNIHPLCKKRRGRGRARGQDSSHFNPCRNMINELSSSQVEDEVAEENIQGKDHTLEKGHQDCVDVESRAQQILVIEIESSDHEYRVNEERREQLHQGSEDNCSNPRLGRRKLTSEPGSKRVGQLIKRNIHPRGTPRTVKGRGRRSKREMRIRETGMNMQPLEATAEGAFKANMVEGEVQFGDQEEQDEGDSLDELIEEVYMELKEAR